MISLGIFSVWIGWFAGSRSGMDQGGHGFPVGGLSRDYVPEVRKSLRWGVFRSIGRRDWLGAVQSFEYWAFGRYQARGIVDGVLYVSVKSGDNIGAVALIWEDDGKARAVGTSPKWGN